nr:unnamed protein product [Callosobruchus analis]
MKNSRNLQRKLLKMMLCS